MKNSEFKKLLQAEFDNNGFSCFRVVKVEEIGANTVMTLNVPVSMSSGSDRLLINWLDSRYSNGVRPMEGDPYKIIINTPSENSKDLYPENANSFSMAFMSLTMNEKTGTISNGIYTPVIATVNNPDLSYNRKYGKGMVDAFNATYANDINPEKIKDLVEVVDDIYATAPAVLLEDAIGSLLFHRLFKALKDVKIKQEVPNDNN